MRSCTVQIGRSKLRYLSRALLYAESSRREARINGGNRTGLSILVKCIHDTPNCASLLMCALRFFSARNVLLLFREGRCPAIALREIVLL